MRPSAAAAARSSAARLDCPRGVECVPIRGRRKAERVEEAPIPVGLPEQDRAVAGGVRVPPDDQILVWWEVGRATEP